MNQLTRDLQSMFTVNLKRALNRQIPVSELMEDWSPEDNISYEAALAIAKDGHDYEERKIQEYRQILKGIQSNDLDSAEKWLRKQVTNLEVIISSRTPEDSDVLRQVMSKMERDMQMYRIILNRIEREAGR